MCLNKKVSNVTEILSLSFFCHTWKCHNLQLDDFPENAEICSNIMKNNEIMFHVQCV